MLRGLCGIIVLNVQTPTEDDANGRNQEENFCEELELVFDQFLKNHMNVLLIDFNGVKR
jgi:hypothetical protein